MYLADCACAPADSGPGGRIVLTEPGELLDALSENTNARAAARRRSELSADGGDKKSSAALC